MTSSPKTPPPESPRPPVRIANCSGFYGDRFRAPHELLAGPEPFDVLTGDYLAELTMLILHKAQLRDPTAGYATTFLRQMHDVLDSCLQRGIRIVSNAGGLNPQALATKLRAINPSVNVAVVDGDDVRELMARRAAGIGIVNADTGDVVVPDAALVTANAYLGGVGIARALSGGADVVVCGRVTDAALVVGPGMWWHSWSTRDLDALAGAVVAGHVIECGPQCCGGNYPFLDELAVGLPGFPIAELAADGSCVITKQPGTGGAVTVGTVTAQLLYEVGSPRYVNPDVVARFDTIEVAQLGPDRVGISGARGEPPPENLKVALNLNGGFRNSMTVGLTGLDIERKAQYFLGQLIESLGSIDQFDGWTTELIRSDHDDAPTNATATAHLRITAKSSDETKVGRKFSNAVVELALSSIAGFFSTAPPAEASAFGIYVPTMIAAADVPHRVRHHDGRTELVEFEVPPTGAWADTRATNASAATAVGQRPWGACNRAPLGTICGARSGDKGGNANVGLWCWNDDAFAWLAETVTPEYLKVLVPEFGALIVERNDFANLRAVNFVVHGLLGEGVAASTRLDAQAKGLGEYVRCRMVDLPKSILAAQ